jgi:hypothetical protein
MDVPWGVYTFIKGEFLLHSPSAPRSFGIILNTVKHCLSQFNRRLLWLANGGAVIPNDSL